MIDEDDDEDVDTFAELEPQWPPKWLREFVEQIHKLLRIPDAQQRFNEEVTKWYAFDYPDGVRFFPKWPNRELALMERFAVLAACHDTAWRGGKIIDCEPLTRTTVRYAVLLAQVKEARKRHLANLLECLEIVSEDLIGKGHRKRPQVKRLNTSRDRWLYNQCCNRTPYKSIIAKLKRKKWDQIESVQGIRNAAMRYAEAEKLEPIPNRQSKQD